MRFHMAGIAAAPVSRRFDPETGQELLGVASKARL
jgi:hypothetical protein